MRSAGFYVHLLQQGSWFKNNLINASEQHKY